MYLIYVDESGITDINDSDGIYLLGAIIVHETDWTTIEEAIVNIKKQFSEIEGTNFELHLKEILSAKGAYYKTDLQKRLSLIKSVYDLIDSMNLRICFSCIKKKEIRKKDLDIDAWAYKLLYERFCWQIEDLNKHHKNPQNAIMFLDSKSVRADNKLRSKLFSYIRDGSEYNHSSLIIEEPVFTKSHYRGLSQIADFVATTLASQFRTRKSNAQVAELYDYGLAVIKKNFYGAKNYYAKIFP